MDIMTDIKNLPELPTVVAKSTMIAQTIKFSADDKAVFAAHRAFNTKYRFPQRVTVPVVDFDGLRIGELVL